MSELARLLEESAERLLAQAEDAERLHAGLVESGLLLALLPETAGGADCQPAEVAVLPRAWGRLAAPLPLVEVLLAELVADAAGMGLTPGSAVLAPPAGHRLDGAGRLSGAPLDAALGPGATSVLVIAGDEEGRDRLVSMPVAAGEVVTGLAGEQRVLLAVAQAGESPALPAGLRAGRVTALGATLTVAAMAGAMESVLDMVLTHARDRVQFGQAIGRFQAVQHLIADAAAETALTASALEAALLELRQEGSGLGWLAAKATAGRAATRVAAVAHQVLGAIGLTLEHPLHRFTTRLWSWRDAWISQGRCEALIGTAALAAGGDGLWPMIAPLSPHAADEETR